MKKVLFYAMTGEKSCFQHVLMNAIDLAADGNEVKIIFEGASVKLPALLTKENYPLYLKARDQGLIAGICLACSKMLGVYEQNQNLGLPLLADMFDHAGIKPWLVQGYEVISI